MPTGAAGDGGASKLEAARQSRINAGMANIDSAFKGYDQNFYNQRAQDYTNFALPQAQKQFDATRKNLAYSLARSGLSNSGAAVNENQALQDTRNQKISDIANEGQNQANELRSNVATNRSNVTNQLLTSSDPSLARESAASATAGLSAPPAFAPIGNLFADYTNTYLANQTAKTYSNAQPDTNWGNLFSVR